MSKVRTSHRNPGQLIVFLKLTTQKGSGIFSRSLLFILNLECLNGRQLTNNARRLALKPNRVQRVRLKARIV